MASSQKSIDGFPVVTIQKVLFSGLKREIAPDHRPFWKKAPKNDIGTKMHVMVPVQPAGHLAINAKEFF